MIKTKIKKINEKLEKNEFNPKIVVGIVGTSDLASLNEIKDFFRMLCGFKLIYLRTAGSHLYITDKKPKNLKEDSNGKFKNK